jgi:hypothetical protein
VLDFRQLNIILFDDEQHDKIIGLRKTHCVAAKADKNFFLAEKFLILHH